MTTGAESAAEAGIDRFRDEPLKVIDVHKMYADRATAIRTMMLAIVGVATAGVSAVIALRKDLSLPLLVGAGIYAFSLLAIGLFLKFRLVALIAEYEACLTPAVIRRHGLLPLDALHGPLADEQEGEVTGARTYSAAILACAAILTTMMVLWGVMRVF